MTDVDRPTYCSEECLLAHETLERKIGEVERLARDHAQRFDTLQTPWWKRILFLIDGWPWYDLNGTQRHRPWHRREP